MYFHPIMSDRFTMLDSITDLGAGHAGTVAISGSHGGLYPASVASRGGLRAVIFNDAGIGLDRAGVAGVAALGGSGMAAAATDGMSCEIGSAGDMWDNGRISVVNAPATALGLAPGMTVAWAAELLDHAAQPTHEMAEVAEARQTRTLTSGLAVTLLDSASLVGPQDIGGVVVTGSHGGLIGGDARRALKAAARIAVFNDAGGGRNGIGTTRLPALEAQGIAAVTVGHDTARIGDAASALETGVISAVNGPARTMGAAVGLGLSDWLETLG
jgi:hypothetical protein